MSLSHPYLIFSSMVLTMMLPDRPERVFGYWLEIQQNLVYRPAGTARRASHSK